MSDANLNVPVADIDLDVMHGGLGNPVLQAQTIFRAIMDAMARPGKVIALASDARPPQPLTPITAAILATLADADTPLWLDASLSESKAVKDWLGFHLGAPLASESSEASFAVISSGKAVPSLDIFAKGLLEYPDRSTTLIIQVDALGNKPLWQLEGPGIKDSQPFSVEPIIQSFLPLWASNNDLFPRGVDVIFSAPDALACLPRTTRISVQDVSRTKKHQEL
ncbi:phosphonate C-P lyase system protein PhnH [uncultured Cohaesibacter sp.]|uniref:phosphonate C-P lyase system protein PhnH n=1 Tax=uncultured Cohaesibacter sp. TaxID=1002546 RepID=UPI00292D3D25|nr:phosphonate C-P lyase system protein PhnH [uncultured Cohaesibacter sp.]